MRFAVALIVAALGCGCSTPPTAENFEALATVAHALASSPAGFEMDGIAGDKRLLFTCVPTPAASQSNGVLVFSRTTGAQLGSVTPPPGGWLAPTGLEVLDYTTTGARTSGTLLVFDNGALPPNARITVYKYAYSHDLVHGLVTTLLESHNLPLQSAPPPAPIDGFGFVDDLHTLPCGTSILTDPLFGAVWACGPAFDDCSLAMADVDFGPAPSPVFTGIGRAPGGGTRPYTLALTVGLSPGVVGAAYMARTDEVCFGKAAQPGGIWCVDRATLLDTTVSPYTKTKRTVVAPTIGLSDGGHGVAADTFHPHSPWLYWIRSYSDPAGGGVNRALRVNVLTGVVETILASNTLLDFGTGITVLPPQVDGSPFANLAIPMGQEENNGFLNATLGGVDAFVAPTLITGVTLPAE